MDFVKYEVGSQLEMNMFGKLKQPSNNIKLIPIWRDTLPGGSCNYKRNWKYFKLFPAYNKVINYSDIIHFN